MPTPRAAISYCALLLAVSGLPLEGQQAASASGTTPGSAQAGLDILHQMDDALVALFDKVAPAVVIIEAHKQITSDAQDQSFDYFFDSPEPRLPGKPGEAPRIPEAPTVLSEGSGFIVRPDGIIYTNLHVVEDSDRIEVKLRDHRHFRAKLVGADERTDIAVLKIDAANLPVVALADSDSVRVGQMCFAIGAPYHLDYSFCRGIVSAKGRGNLESTATKPMYEDYIQTDAFINPGNSGGPLFDVDGRVMGMNTLINGIGRGLSFAIPSNLLNDVGRELIATGHANHPWIGVVVTTLDSAPSGGIVDQGVRVQTIEPGAPAYKSDLRPQDLIAKVDGAPVQTPHDLQLQIIQKKIGSTIHLTVQRSGRTVDVPVVTEELPADLTSLAQNHAEARVHPADATSYGLQLAPAQPGSRAEPVHDKTTAGVVVTAVEPDSSADRAGIRAGDVITAVDKQPVTEASRCMNLLTSHRGPAGPILFITRGGHKASAVLDNDGAEKP